MSTQTIRHTLDQLPGNAKAYYAESVAPGVFTREFVGMDDAGRRIYQPMFDGETYGSPRALLTYAEFSRAVKAAARISLEMGVPRWTEPYRSNG